MIKRALEIKKDEYAAQEALSATGSSAVARAMYRFPRATILLHTLVDGRKPKSAFGISTSKQDLLADSTVETLTAIRE
jgi:hypothetical protein